MATLFCCAAAAVTVQLWTPAAHAQDAACFPAAEMLSALANHFHQARVAGGAATGGHVEIFATVDGSAWTLIITREDGSACVVGAGTDWQTAAPALDPTKGDLL